MTIIRPFLILAVTISATVCSPFIVLYLATGPAHDFVALRNTTYSSAFTAERFEQLKIGLSKAAVVDLLGSPVEATFITNWPAWALRDEGVRRHYGTNAELLITNLSFSRPKKNGDYE